MTPLRLTKDLPWQEELERLKDEDDELTSQFPESDELLQCGTAPAMHPAFPNNNSPAEPQPPCGGTISWFFLSHVRL